MTLFGPNHLPKATPPHTGGLGCNTEIMVEQKRSACNMLIPQVY